MTEVSREFLQLCGKLRDEEITEGELASLEKRLRENPEERAYYLQFMQIDALLETFPPIIEEAPAGEPGHRDHRFRGARSGAFGWIAAAAGLTLAVIFGIQAWRQDGESGNGTRAARLNIGTLVLAENCRWEGQPYSEGQRLVAGGMNLSDGTALVRFDGGAELAWKGPAEILLEGPTTARLLHGEVVVRAGDGGQGFALDTPSGRLVDLGTEFTVKVDDAGATELHVHEGAVALGEKDGQASDQVIAAGDAVRMPGAIEDGWDKVKLDAPRFRELIQSARPGERRDLMTAYEGFHVEPGTYLPHELKGGKGWNGPWRLRTPAERQDHLADTTDRLTIAMSQMEVAWPIRGGQAGMLELPGGPNVWIRGLKKPVKMNKWGIQYFSFLVTEPEVSVTRREDGKWDRQDLRFTFRSSDDYFGESLSIGWERSLRPRLATDSGPSVRAIRAIPGGGTVFCVTKIETRKSGGDRISFRFYTKGEPLDIVEPAEWDITVTDVHQEAVFDLLVLTSHSREIRYLDEIRIGPSWRSVTPIDRTEFMISSHSAP